MKRLVIFLFVCVPLFCFCQNSRNYEKEKFDTTKGIIVIVDEDMDVKAYYCLRKRTAFSEYLVTISSFPWREEWIPYWLVTQYYVPKLKKYINAKREIAFIEE